MNFRSDNVAPIAEEILEAIAAANTGAAAPYGEDDVTGRLDDAFAKVFEHEVRVLPAATGTAANCLALAMLVDDGGAIYCHEDAHIAVAEEGAPAAFIPGAELVALTGTHGKIAPSCLAAALDRGPTSNAVLSLTQVTEWGTAYRPNEIAALTGMARGHRLRVHMDGARFANAVASLGCAPADVTWRAGVDALSFGASKNGALNAEAVVLFDPALAEDTFALRKRTGHVYSKMRFVSAQLEAMSKDGLWLRLAARANAMGRRLADGLEGVPGVTFLASVEASMLFVKISDALREGLLAEGFQFETWRGGEITRLVTNYATREEDVDALVTAARRLSAN